MTVTAEHPQYSKFLPRWVITKAVVDGDVRRFLRDVDPRGPHPTGPDSKRNAQYKEDAILTNFTARTKQGLVGAAFRREPEADLPSELEYMKVDATGNNLTLNQLAQAIVGDVLETGRGGLLVDFPITDLVQPTKDEIEEIGAKARIYQYDASCISNWHAIMIGSKTVMDLIVLRESKASIADDGFTWVEEIQFRVLRLEHFEGFEGPVYTQQLFDEMTKPITNLMVPLRDGEPWPVIPFVFVGAENNDEVVDNAPLYDLSRLNIGHLKNSADYEESIHITGQPTLFFTTDHDTASLAAALPDGIRIGSRTGHNLGQNGSWGLLQPEPNQLADVAMQRKEQQAVMTGARLITPATTNTTAEEARMRHSSEVSVLTTVVKNVSKALGKALGFVGEFMAVDTTALVYNINTQFFDVKADPNEIMAELQLLASGVIAQSDMRKYARENGLVDPTRTDEEIDAEISSAPAISMMSPEQQEEDKQDQEE